MIKRHEGLRLDVYQCSQNFHTVGYGHNLDAHDDPIPSEPIIMELAEEYFDKDLRDAIYDAGKLPVYFSLDEVRQCALIDLVFNMGVKSVFKFHKMLQYIAVSDYNNASIQLLDSLYARQVGKRADEIAEMIRTGDWKE